MTDVVSTNYASQIAQRIHQNLPDHFPAELSNLQIIGHNVGIRPGRKSGIRIEKEEKNGQKIVHVYGKFRHSARARPYKV